MSRVYIINDSLFFHESENILSLYGDMENSLQLPVPSSRLLTELIKSNGVLLSRDDILKKVWEDHGFRASSSNLNNYLSILRKQIALLLPHQNVITTIPKKGVMLSADVVLRNNSDLHKDSEPSVLPVPATPIPDKMLVTDGINTTEEKKLKKLTFYISITLTLTLLSWLAFYFNTFIELQAPPKAPLILLKSRGQCVFYSLPGSKAINNFEESVLSNLDIKLDCENKPTEVYIGYGNDANTHRQMAFVSWCTKENNRHYSRCDNVKRQTWSGL
ncbi:winged helix-turn-helix domain-containing protein [Enterobacter ludwigii]|uniref:winged helix-turn-helix domain-containing protein n=1 Tax=Enterobacter ludwigii TaxID=299767 RepID=UPI002FD300B6